ncbi:MAG: hypothetical protein ACXADC_15830 [Candidatus Thorarchaeota archaeon]|jgi:NhaP-type Na+/H+ and K+/H+ antiporter
MEETSGTWSDYIRSNWKRILRNFAIFTVVFYLAFWVVLYLFVGPPQEHLFSYIVTPAAFIVIFMFVVIPVWEFLGPPKSAKDDSKQEL